MTYERFEQLPVWQAGIGLGRQVYALTAKRAFRHQRSLRDQFERAAVSASNNIAEGFERGTTQELLMFLYIARGSAGEVRSMLCLPETLPGFENFNSEVSNFKSEAEGVSRQLRAWADSPQNSKISGQRYLTEEARKATRAREEREQFLDELRRLREASAGQTRPVVQGEPR
jgi:four helix bundle protein